MNTTIIRIMGHSHPDADPLPSDPCYLMSYKPEARGGHGEVVLTDDRDHAHRYGTFEEAFEHWRAQPRNHPVRLSDGKPNRPLTAYSVLFEDYDNPPLPTDATEADDLMALVRAITTQPGDADDDHGTFVVDL